MGTPRIYATETLGLKSWLGFHKGRCLTGNLMVQSDLRLRLANEPKQALLAGAAQPPLVPAMHQPEQRPVIPLERLQARDNLFV